jgi:hypothetical protein
MSMIKKAEELYNSNKMPDYARGGTLIARVAFTLSQIDELMQMFIEDHVLPVAKKLGYKVKQEEGITEFDYSNGYACFRRQLELTKRGFPKEGNKLLVIVEPGNVEVRYEKPHNAGGSSIHLENPTFSLIENIKEYAKEV